MPRRSGGLRFVTIQTLAVRHHPDIGEYAGVVEKLVGQRHDGVEPVVLDDPAADVGRPRSGVAGKQRGAVEDDGDLGAGPVLVPLLIGVHLGNHVLKKEEGAVVDGRKTRAEPAGEAHGPVLAFDRLLLVFPFDAEGRVGHQVMEEFVFEAIPGLAIAQGVTEDDVGGVLVLDEHVRAADCPGLVVVFLAEEREQRPLVLRQDQLLGFGKHAARSARRIVDRAVDAGPVDILFAGVDEVRHEANDLARREVIPGFFVGLLVEAHHQMLEQVAHLEVVDSVGVKIDIGHRLHDREKAVAGVELLDLIGELETLEDAARGRGKAVDVRDQVRRDVLGIAEQPGKGVGARVVERMLPPGVGRLPQQAIHRRVGHLLRLQLIAPLQNGIPGRFQDTIEPTQDDHGKHDQAILRRPVRSSKPVRDFPDFGLKLFVCLYVHLPVLLNGPT